MKTFVLGMMLAMPALTQVVPAPENADTYYLVLLRRRPDRKPLSQAEGDRIQAARMANIQAMANRGILVAAGPFEDTPPEISGLFLFRAPTMAEAKAAADADPTVVEHRNSVEIMEWRGPKGMGEEYRRLHVADPKTPEGMGVHPLALVLKGGSREDVVAKSRGKLAAWGPVIGDGRVAGVLVFQRISDEEAKAALAGVSVEWHRWWSAAHVMP